MLELEQYQNKGERMIKATLQAIEAALQTVVDPTLNQDLVSAQIVRDIQILGDKISLTLLYPYPILQEIPHLKQAISEVIHSAFPDYKLDLVIQSKINRHVVQSGLKPKSVIKNIIAVGSGKGGVGKSTVSINLALALKALGAKVALLDADIYGPSQPRMLGKGTERARTINKKLIPIENYGIESISIGYLIDEQSPMVWRGPMVSGALQQLLNDTAWSECDYMIIDLPPGTGDIQLTLAQKIPLAGAVIVTTPQDIALLDAKKACHMFNKVNVKVLGLIENMSWHQCSQCQHIDAIFGQGGGEVMAAEFAVPLLGQLPLLASIRQWSDAGQPIIIAEPDGMIAQTFLNIAKRLSGHLAQQEIDNGAMLASVVVHE